jgi:hypothetical protein
MVLTGGISSLFFFNPNILEITGKNEKDLSNYLEVLMLFGNLVI